MKRQAYQLLFTGSAGRDFMQIMEWSAGQFGAAAADRYEGLIGRALAAVGEDPFRPGARRRPDLADGMYTFHLSSSQERGSAKRVKAPRHFLLYRVVSFRVEVLRILHDSRDLARHLPGM